MRNESGISKDELLALGYVVKPDSDQPGLFVWVNDHEGSDISFPSELETMQDAQKAAIGIFDLCRCDNCRKLNRLEDLVPAKHLAQRVDAGGPMPSGECPDCGALAYAIDGDSHGDSQPGAELAQAIEQRDALLACVKDMLAACDANDGDAMANAANDARQAVMWVDGAMPVDAKPQDESSLRKTERAMLADLRQRGFAVIVINPGELGDADPGQVQDRCIQLGNQVIGDRAGEDAGEGHA